TSKLSRTAMPLDSRLQRQLLATFVPAGVGIQSLLPREATDSVFYVGGSGPVAEANVADALRRLPAAPPEATMLNLAVHAPRASIDVWRADAHGALLPRFWQYRPDATELQCSASNAVSTQSD